jgi:hypothetical protein
MILYNLLYKLNNMTPHTPVLLITW